MLFSGASPSDATREAGRMSKFSRNKNPQGSSSSDKSSPIELIELEKGNRNKWQVCGNESILNSSRCFLELFSFSRLTCLTPCCTVILLGFDSVVYTFGMHLVSTIC